MNFCDGFPVLPPQLFIESSALSQAACEYAAHNIRLFLFQYGTGKPQGIRLTVYSKHTSEKLCQIPALVSSVQNHAECVAFSFLWFVTGLCE